MATTTLNRNRVQEKAGTWSGIFPTEQVTEQQSTLFVKKLLAVAVSNITYLRAIFPEHAFGDRCLEDLNLKILRDDSNCPGACQVIKWVKGCFDALDKKYLRMLVVGIYVNPDDPETVIESYTFKFSYLQNTGIDIYRNKKKISSACNATETKKATIRLLRTIVVLTQTLQSLPDDVMMTMKLLYYDDVTPADYEPPGFQPSELDNFRFEEDPMNIKVGDVSTMQRKIGYTCTLSFAQNRYDLQSQFLTMCCFLHVKPFHTVKLRIKTDAKQFDVQEVPEEEAEEPIQQQETENRCLDQEEAMAIDEQATRETTTEGEVELAEKSLVTNNMNRSGGFLNQVVPEPVQCDDVPKGTPVKPGTEDQATFANLDSQKSDVEQDDFGVKCPCGCNEDDGLMILCAKCKFWQHGVCFCIMKEEEAPEVHICNICGDPSNKENIPTDPDLHGLAEVALQARCLWRRALLACTETSHVQVPNFARRLGVEMTVGQGLVNRLEKEGYLKNASKGKRLGKIVNKETILNEGLKKYFKRKSEETPMESQDDGVQQTVQEPVKEVVQEKPIVNKGKRKLGKKQVDEIEVLTAKAEEMSLSRSTRSTRSQSVKCNSANMENQETEKPKPVSEIIKKQLSESATTGPQGRGVKRAVSVAYQDQEFEISNSQERSQDINYDQRRQKKRKASVVRKAILV